MKITKVTKTAISKIYRMVQNDTHKGIQGHVLIIGGSYGKIRAPLLSSKAALYSGCGLVMACVPKIIYSILQTAVPEVMNLPDKSTRHISDIDFLLFQKQKQLELVWGKIQKYEVLFTNF